MPRISSSNIIGVLGIALTIVLLVLDKAGKLGGAWLYGLLAPACGMTLFIAIGNSWVLDSKAWMIWRAILMLCVVLLTYSGLAIWISQSPTGDRTASGIMPELAPVTAENHPAAAVPAKPSPPIGDAVPANKPPKRKLPSGDNPTAEDSSNWLSKLKNPPTVADVFANDFPYMAKLSDDGVIGIRWNDTGAFTPVQRKLYLDFPANTKFVGFYIPPIDPVDSSRTRDACLGLSKGDAVQQALDDIPKKTAVVALLGQAVTVSDLTFSGRVLIYHSDFLSVTDQADIIRSFATKNYRAGFFGPIDLEKTLTEWHRLHDEKTH